MHIEIDMVDRGERSEALCELVGAQYGLHNRSLFVGFADDGLG
jgi:hypothetical protein